MNDESLAQIGEDYAQAQEEKKSAAPEEKNSAAMNGDEFDIRVLGDLVCEVTDVVFSRIGWKELSAEERQLLSSSCISLIKKRIPKVVGWGSEVSFGIIVATIILTRVGIPDRGEEDGKGVTDSPNLGTQGRGKDIFPRRPATKIE